MAEEEGDEIERGKKGREAERETGGDKKKKEREL